MDLLVFLLLALMAMAMVARAVVVVPQGKVFLVERLGRYERTLAPGISVILPFVDRVSARVPQGELVVDLPATEAVSLDNRTVTLSGQVRYRVVDPRRAVYDVADYEQAIAAVASRTLSQLASEAEAVHVPAVLRAAAARARPLVGAWGVEIAALDALVTRTDAETT